ncbi:hypothetical protein ACIP4U_26835 [Streptomyces caelestis]|jgi:hypothetical protein|uniref:hypothetical protein n=1 Tax=Streptomyces caelestis TaxID=36816 RepID=UPI003822907D
MTHLEARRNLTDQQPEHHTVDKLCLSLVGDLTEGRREHPGRAEVDPGNPPDGAPIRVILDSLSAQ